jgi:hypothetical protein
MTGRVADHSGQREDVLLDAGREVSRPMTWVTRARVIPSRRAMAAWLGASPDSRSACHSRALRRSSTTRGIRGSFGGLGFPRGGGMAEVTWSAGTRRVRQPTLPFSKDLFGEPFLRPHHGGTAPFNTSPARRRPGASSCKGQPSRTFARRRAPQPGGRERRRRRSGPPGRRSGGRARGRPAAAITDATAAGVVSTGMGWSWTEAPGPDHSAFGVNITPPCATGAPRQRGWVRPIRPNFFTSRWTSAPGRRRSERRTGGGGLSTAKRARPRRRCTWTTVASGTPRAAAIGANFSPAAGAARSGAAASGAPPGGSGGGGSSDPPARSPLALVAPPQAPHRGRAEIEALRHLRQRLRRQPLHHAESPGGRQPR